MRDVSTGLRKCCRGGLSKGCTLTYPGISPGYVHYPRVWVPKASLSTLYPELGINKYAFQYSTQILGSNRIGLEYPPQYPTQVSGINSMRSNTLLKCWALIVQLYRDLGYVLSTHLNTLLKCRLLEVFFSIPYSSLGYSTYVFQYSTRISRVLIVLLFWIRYPKRYFTRRSSG